MACRSESSEAKTLLSASASPSWISSSRRAPTAVSATMWRRRSSPERRRSMRCAAFQLVEQPDQVGPVDTQRFGERRLTRFAQYVQHRQRNHVARAQIEVRQLRLHLGVHAPGDELQQRTEQAPRPGERKRKFIHETSIALTTNYPSDIDGL